MFEIRHGVSIRVAAQRASRRRAGPNSVWQDRARAPSRRQLRNCAARITFLASRPRTARIPSYNGRTPDSRAAPPARLREPRRRAAPRPAGSPLGSRAMPGIRMRVPYVSRP
ncbi:hypothetical protein A33K_15878 [Burkholderia humptydooensis MSMB43]|uniref:Uncharacterized protein n=1 Tax=Burkholderia humptydooensis MSMB43 TaxID=441157 RepID=A0ABN0G6H0_9BURK|nr:hypothetical protein A33K_15878 [Burkholderia humptydooensis MSMB43]